MTPTQLNLITQAATVDLDAEEWRDALSEWLDIQEYRRNVDAALALIDWRWEP